VEKFCFERKLTPLEKKMLRAAAKDGKIDLNILTPSPIPKTIKGESFDAFIIDDPYKPE
jgi:hypothetical protein